MGSKYTGPKNISFLEEDEGEDISGIVGGCYCCSQNIHVTFNHLDASPVAQIDGSYFYIVICDQCEEDIMFLRESGEEEVSYDILWLIQENLATELYNIVSKDGEIDPDIREGILLRLYQEADKKLDNKKSSKYLSRLGLKDYDDGKNSN